MDNLLPEQRQKNMKSIRSMDTKPEELVRKRLFAAGFRYRLCDKRYPGKPDIVLPRYRTFIYIHGCFWHQHPECRYAVIPKSNRGYWVPKLARNAERDRENIEKAVALGWKVVIVWECATKSKCIDLTLARLVDVIKNGLPSDSPYVISAGGVEC